MIYRTSGNLLAADVEALVNTVNTVGVMGRGIALQMSRAYPSILPPYEKACKDGSLKPGTVLTVNLHQFHHPKYVICVPTKRHWKGKSKIEDIESGLAALAAEIGRLGITTIAVPPLGCGLGGLEWSQVYPRIEAALGHLEGVDVFVYEPSGTPDAASMVAKTERPKMTSGQAALLGLMRRYLVPLMDDSVTLLEVHKLMYLQQEAGERLRLQYVKGHYGPYARNLTHVLKRIEGHFIVGFGDGGEAPGKVIEAQPDAATEAEAMLADHTDTQKRMDRVVRLIEGFETPFGMELLATVHWVATHEDELAKSDPAVAVERVAAWTSRKKQLFDAGSVHAAWERLRDHGWLSNSETE